MAKNSTKTIKKKTPQTRLVERNIDLNVAFMRYLVRQPAMLDRLPNDFRLVILPEDDPELTLYNLSRMKIRRDKTKPIVIVFAGPGGKFDFRRRRPEILASA